MKIEQFLSRAGNMANFSLLALAVALRNGGELSATQLTVHLGGSSGKGAKCYRNELEAFSLQGFLNRRQTGRAIYYSASSELLSWGRKHPEYAEKIKWIDRCVGGGSSPYKIA